MTDEPRGTATAIDQMAHAEAHGSAPAFNILFPEVSAEKLEIVTARFLSTLQRNSLYTGAVVGAIGAGCAVLMIWAITALNKDETAHTLCAYEYNLFQAEIEAKQDVGKVLSELKAAGCKA